MLKQLSPRMRRGIAIALYVIVVSAMPFILQTVLSSAAYPTSLMILIKATYFAIAAIGLNFIVGYCGLLNLGFAGFMLIGAYTTGILMKEFNFSFLAATLISIAHGAFWGIVLGLPTLRLTGDYFAIVTFGFGELMIMVARNWVSMTRGTKGYPGIPTAEIFGIKFSNLNLGSERLNSWYVAAALLGIVMLVADRLWRSRVGRAWAAIREDEVAAQACGINTMWYKTLAFAISAGIGALAGAFDAGFSAFVDSRNYEFMVSISILAYLVLGGMGSVKGAVLGTLVLYGLGELLRTSPALYLSYVMGWWPEAQAWLAKLPWVADMRLIAYGLILVVMIRFRPEGLLPCKTRARELHKQSGNVDTASAAA